MKQLGLVKPGQHVIQHCPSLLETLDLFDKAPLLIQQARNLLADLQFPPRDVGGVGGGGVGVVGRGETDKVGEEDRGVATEGGDEEFHLAHGDVSGEGGDADAVGIDVDEAAEFGAVALAWFEAKAGEEEGEGGGAAGLAGGVARSLLGGGRNVGGRMGNAASGGGSKGADRQGAGVRTGWSEGAGDASAVGKVGAISVGRSAEGDFKGSGGSAESSGSGEGNWGGGRAGGLAGS